MALSPGGEVQHHRAETLVESFVEWWVTILDRALRPIRRELHYPIVAALLVIVFVLSYGFEAYFDPPDFLRGVFRISAGDRLPLWLAFLNGLLWMSFILYTFLAIRYMREVLERRLGELDLVFSDKDGLQRLLRTVAHPVYPLLLAGLLAAPFLPSFLQGWVKSSGLYAAVHLPVSFIAIFVLFATFLWVFASSCYGTYLLMRGNSNTKEYYEDSALGLHPIGSLCLSVGSLYFFGVLLWTVNLRTEPYAPLEILPFLLGPGVGLGLAMLPVYHAHLKILQKKRDYEVSLLDRLARLARGEAEAKHTGQERLLDDIREFLSLEMMERRVAAIDTWPVKAPVFRKFLSALVSIVIADVVRLAFALAA